jgi:surfeit locus 1 family protein
MRAVLAQGRIIAAARKVGVSRRMPLALGWALTALVVAGFCALGSWQLERSRQKQQRLDAVHQVLQQRSQPSALSTAADPAQRDAYHWVAGQGQFIAEAAVLLDNQTREGRVGIRIYRPFRPAGAELPLLVDLGWLPLPADRTLPVLAPPPAAAHLRGLLVPPPSAGFVSTAPVTQADGHLLVAALDLPQLAQALGLPALAPRVLKLDPDLPLGYARDLDILPNTLPPERHLGYAVQWFGLALAVLVTALVLTWRGRGGGKAIARRP